MIAQDTMMFSSTDTFRPRRIRLAELKLPVREPKPKETPAVPALPAAPAVLPVTLHGFLCACLCLFIGWVGAVDTYLTIKFQDVMHAVERNPVGRFLIALDHQHVSLFVGVKVAGIVLVLCLLGWICMCARSTFAYMILVPVALAQLCLLLFLFFA